MIKAVAFDLDDTLLSKRKYDHECLRSVAKYISESFNIDFKNACIPLLKEYDELNRSHTIDAVLKQFGIFSEELLQELIEVYRNTKARDCLCDDTISTLEKTQKMGLLTILITDGKIEAQKKKIQNVGIEKYFSKAVFTYAFGENRKKPDRTAFQQILGDLGINGHEMIYVGDNPYRDFIEVRKLGIHTIRIKRADGQFGFAELPREYEADHEIYELNGVFEYINSINDSAEARNR